MSLALPVFIYSSLILPKVLSKNCLQKGHWKSLNSTIVIGALELPRIGKLPGSTSTFSGGVGWAGALAVLELKACWVADVISFLISLWRKRILLVSMPRRKERIMSVIMAKYGLKWFFEKERRGRLISRYSLDFS